MFEYFEIFDILPFSVFIKRPNLTQIMWFPTGHSIVWRWTYCYTNSIIIMRAYCITNSLQIIAEITNLTWHLEYKPAIFFFTKIWCKPPKHLPYQYRDFFHWCLLPSSSYKLKTHYSPILKQYNVCDSTKISNFMPDQSLSTVSIQFSIVPWESTLSMNYSTICVLL